MYKRWINEEDRLIQYGQMFLEIIRYNITRIDVSKSLEIVKGYIDNNFFRWEDDVFNTLEMLPIDGNHYPIEIQYNIYYDRQFNNWLHKYVYKKKYDNSVGCHLRELYEGAKILTEKDFKETLKHVLFSS